jgi:hypothetical protein
LLHKQCQNGWSWVGDLVGAFEKGKAGTEKGLPFSCWQLPGSISDYIAVQTGQAAVEATCLHQGALQAKTAPSHFLRRSTAGDPGQS